MLLLQLPVWSYVVLATAALMVGVAITRAVAAHRARLARRNDERRARAAASILRVLTNKHVRKIAGVSND